MLLNFPIAKGMLITKATTGIRKAEYFGGLSNASPRSSSFSDIIVSKVIYLHNLKCPPLIVAKKWKI
jgi:hypothetical protein